MSRSAVALLAAAIAGSTSAHAESQLDFSGYYKNLLRDSRTVIPAGDAYWLDLNRLRLELKGQVAHWIALDLQYDNEILLGSYLENLKGNVLRQSQFGEFELRMHRMSERGAPSGGAALEGGNVEVSRRGSGPGAGGGGGAG